jgi:hypothetical protein
MLAGALSILALRGDEEAVSGSSQLARMPASASARRSATWPLLVLDEVLAPLTCREAEVLSLWCSRTSWASPRSPPAAVSGRWHEQKEIRGAAEETLREFRDRLDPPGHTEIV